MLVGSSSTSIWSHIGSVIKLHDFVVIIYNSGWQLKYQKCVVQLKTFIRPVCQLLKTTLLFWQFVSKQNNINTPEAIFYILYFSILTYSVSQSESMYSTSLNYLNMFDVLIQIIHIGTLVHNIVCHWFFTIQNITV